jgi:hypothetical protein
MVKGQALLWAKGFAAEFGVAALRRSANEVSNGLRPHLQLGGVSAAMSKQQ